ncbi:hypothetical protein COLO4_09179 [Corchorus olitorius]|uniref:Uncharacterized protein n=1 Tax=Corchorus olitorius TaxID=93759 RepID=A0A1R3KCY1_9ROSI|nr:hypothetical protein COLO4_09179 [Corchorus olitorius]
MAMDPSSSLPQNMEEYSASATILKFDSPIPLLRGPIPAGPSDDPESGPYLLAFKDLPSWAAAYKSSESKIISQCEEAARIGCAIAASNKCKPPWWQSLMGYKSMDLKERERCEVREMEECLVTAKGKCVSFAKEKCGKPFLQARIAVARREVRNKVVRKLIHIASMPEESAWRDLIGLDKLGEFEITATNCIASQFLSSGARLQT